MARMYYRPVSSDAGRKVFLATPAYQGLGAGYSFALFHSATALRDAGIAAEISIFEGNCHVDDSRNRLVRDFLQSDCTDMVFLDADLRWQPGDLVKLCEYDCDVVAATYPLKQEEDAFPVRLLPDETMTNGLIEAEAVPTGFLRMRRHVLERLADDAQKFMSKSDDRGPLPLIFERTVENQVRWGGDYTFCRKWRATGGRIFVDPEMTMEHSGTSLWTGSFGAHRRRQAGGTLRYVADRIRDGKETIENLTEAWEAVGNPYGARADVLSLCVLLARQATGPIIEAGSGLSTILMAAATDQPIFCIEHDRKWAAQLERMAMDAGVGKIGVCLTSIRDGWYDLEPFPDLPERFALGVNDGPPRQLGSRMGFFHNLAERCETIIVDDVDDPGYRAAVKEWCGDRVFDRIEKRAALIRKPAKKRDAA